MEAGGWAAIAQAGAQAAGGFSGLLGGFNQAKINRKFQATAYQRTVGDMKAAGLNPAMMYKSGAGTPAAGGGGNPDTTGAIEAGRAVGSGLQAYITRQQLDIQKQQLELQRQKNESEVNLNDRDANLRNLQALNEVLRGPAIEAGTGLDIARTENLKSERANIEADTLLKQAQARGIDANTAQAQVVAKFWKMLEPVADKAIGVLNGWIKDPQGSLQKAAKAIDGPGGVVVDTMLSFGGMDRVSVAKAVVWLIQQMMGDGKGKGPTADELNRNEAKR